MSRTGFFLLIARELANGASAIRKCVQERISPAGGKERGELLVDGLVGLREKAHELTRRRSHKLPDGNYEVHFASARTFLEGEHVELSELLRNILLGKSPVAHDSSTE